MHTKVQRETIIITIFHWNSKGVTCLYIVNYIESLANLSIHKKSVPLVGFGAKLFKVGFGAKLFKVGFGAGLHFCGIYNCSKLNHF